MAETFKWCFVGTGTLAWQVAREITHSGRHEIVSVHTRRLEKGRAFAQKYGGVAYENAEEAMTAEGVQGVYVVTPHNSHYQYVRQSLELGRSVLCEKPFTTDADQAEELLALAREKGVYAAEAMWTWFSPMAHRVKKWLDDGECGDIRQVVANYHMDIRGYAPRLTDPNLAGGALLDIGVYPITYLYRLFGNPVKIVCNGVVENGIDLEENIDLTFAGGETCRASVSMRDFKGFEKFFVSGTKGSIQVKGFHAAKRAKLTRNQGPCVTFASNTNYLSEFNIAADEILAGRGESVYVPRQATLDVMRVMDECRRQMKLVYPFEREKTR